MVRRIVKYVDMLVTCQGTQDRDTHAFRWRVFEFLDRLQLDTREVSAEEKIGRRRSHVFASQCERLNIERSETNSLSVSEGREQ